MLQRTSLAGPRQAPTGRRLPAGQAFVVAVLGRSTKERRVGEWEEFFRSRSQQVQAVNIWKCLSKNASSFGLSADGEFFEAKDELDDDVRPG